MSERAASTPRVLGWLDGALQRLGKRAVDAVPWPPSWLARVSEQAVAEVLATKQSEISQARSLCLSPTRAAEVEDLARGLLADMRAAVRRMAASSAGLSAAERLSEWIRADEPEWMDDPTFDLHRRSALLSAVDRGHRISGAYLRFLELLEPLLAVPSAGPVTVLDLASGHAGFAVAVAERLRAWPGGRVIASDVRAESLDLGLRRARAAGLVHLSARVVDALGPAEGWSDEPIDVVTCTMALHHFSPGAVVRLLAQALRAARRGVLMVDLTRGVRPLLIAASSLAIDRDPALRHDAIASVRRAFTAQELRLLACLAPGGERMECLLLRPGLVALRGRVEVPC